MAKQMKVGIAIVNYRQASMTVDCVKSLEKSTYEGIEVVVVDNCSGDDSVEVLKANLRSPRVHILESDVNGGFAPGTNMGMRHCFENLHTDCVMLLNNDTIVDKELVQRLVEGLEENVVTAPKIYWLDDRSRIWYAGGDINRFTGRIAHRGKGEVDNGEYDKECYVTFASGCCILVPKYVVERIGYLPEEYFMYVEDVDYCLKMQENGIRIKYVPSAHLYHKEGGSQKGKGIGMYYDLRNKFHLYRKYGFCPMAHVLHLAHSLLRRFKGLLIGNHDYELLAKAYRDYRKGIMGKFDLSPKQ